MSSRARLLLVLSLTAFVIGGAVIYSAERFSEWHRDGWTGMFYNPSFPASRTKQGGMRMSQQRPGEVMLTYSNSPGDGQFKGGDRVLSVNGIPIEDMRRLREIEPTLHRGDVV